MLSFGQTAAMLIALGILLSLVSFCPVILTLDGPFLPNLAPLLLAFGLILVAIWLPPGEAQRFAKRVRPFVIAAAVPAAWMLFQMLPLPVWHTGLLAKISALAHPVWASAAAELRQDMAGSISVDIGATAVALVRYLTFVGVILLSTAVTMNRERAESVLVTLAIATGLVAFIVACADIVGGDFLAAREEALDCAALGVSLSAACASLVLERHEKQRAGLNLKETRFVIAASACLAAFFVCSAVIVATRSGSLIFAAGGGLVTFCAVLIVRRLDLGRWGASAITVTAIAIGVALVTGSAGTNSDPRFAFVKKDAASIELTQRILTDAPVLGDGAGTFASMVPIYQSADANPGDLEAVTAAAKLSIEMGRPVLWIAVLAAALATLALLRGASNRGRDYYYPAAGAACLVTMMISAFINVGLFGSALPLLAGTILGLGLAQSQSPTLS